MSNPAEYSYTNEDHGMPHLELLRQSIKSLKKNDPISKLNASTIAVQKLLDDPASLYILYAKGVTKADVSWMDCYSDSLVWRELCALSGEQKPFPAFEPKSEYLSTLRGQLDNKVPVAELHGQGSGPVTVEGRGVRRRRLDDKSISNEDLIEKLLLDEGRARKVMKIWAEKLGYQIIPAQIVPESTLLPPATNSSNDHLEEGRSTSQQAPTLERSTLSKDSAQQTNPEQVQEAIAEKPQSLGRKMRPMEDILRGKPRSSPPPRRKRGER